MSTLFFVSYGALWLLFVVQAVLLFLLYRHIGMVILGTGEGVQRDGLGVGEVALAVGGVTTEGREVRWVPQAGRSELLVFAAPDCEPCAEVFPYINRLATVPNGDGVPVTTVVQGASGRAVLAVEKLGSAVPVLAEDGSGAFDRYRVRVTPFAFVIGEDGRVQAKGVCGSPNALKQLLIRGGLSEAATLLEPGLTFVHRHPDVTVAERMV
ncbi:MAG: TlpA disulfide reductase family protein [Thermomicrobiales bacterium]